MINRTSFLICFCALVLFSLSIIAESLEPRQQSSYDFSGCSSDQQQKINGYLDDVQELAKAAIGPSEASQAGNYWYKAWWGTYDSSIKMLLDEKINTRYEKLSVWKHNKGTSRTFACNPDATCCDAGVFTGGVVACQNTRGDQEIVLCSPFWRWENERIGDLAKQSQPINLMLDKWRTRSAILLHELTHALFKTFDQVWYPDGAKTVAYGHQHDLQYTLNDTAGARLNADHYEKFAMAAYYGNGNVNIFATRPDDVASGPHY